MEEEEREAPTTLKKKNGLSEEEVKEFAQQLSAMQPKFDSSVYNPATDIATMLKNGVFNAMEFSDEEFDHNYFLTRVEGVKAVKKGVVKKLWSFFSL